MPRDDFARSATSMKKRRRDVILAPRKRSTLPVRVVAAMWFFFLFTVLSNKTDVRHAQEDQSKVDAAFADNAVIFVQCIGAFLSSGRLDLTQRLAMKRVKMRPDDGLQYAYSLAGGRLAAMLQGQVDVKSLKSSSGCALCHQA